MRYLLSFLLLSTYLFALISKPVHSKITSIDEENQRVTISSVKGAQIGMYGVIVHHFTNSHSIALDWVKIISTENNRIEAEMIPILALEQSALPTGTWTPKVNDEVILGYNYHRALLIAPNPSIYKKVTDYHKERYWVHPDIFAANLSYNGHPSPLVEDFTQTCRANNIGIVAFVFDQSIISVDCQSFEIIQNKSISEQTDEIQLPFYTRVTKIEASWFGEGSSEMKAYSPYYVNLLAESNPKNEWIQNYKQKLESKDKGSSWFSSWLPNVEVTIGDESYEDGFEKNHSSDK